MELISMGANDHLTFRTGQPPVPPLVDGPSSLPNHLGEYQLLNRIGAGGMGSVYRARHRRLQKVVAIKILPVDDQDNPESIARFEREMLAVGRLEHPNIIRAHDAGEERGVHYLVLEYADGCDLSKLSTQTGPLTIADACELIRQSALGLQYAHENGMVHRDIKPSNLLLNRDGTVKILDLGLALLSGESSPVGGGELTTTGQIMGTLDFLAPEQADDTHSVDIRADIYSLGCTLYSLLIGHAPFVGESYSTPVRKIGAHMNRPMPNLCEKREEIPEGVNEILQKMTAKVIEDRYATPGDVAEALTAFSTNHHLESLIETVTIEDDEMPSATIETEDLRRNSIFNTRNHDEFSIDTGLLRTPKPERSWSGTGQYKWLIGLGLFGLIAIAGTIIVIRDENGRAVAQVAVPEGGSYEEIQANLDSKSPEVDSSVEVTKNMLATSTSATSAIEESDQIDGDKSWHGWPADAPVPMIPPVNTDQAKAHQDAWATYLDIPVEYENSIGMKLRLVPPTEFFMGSTPKEMEIASSIKGRNLQWKEIIKTEIPRHKVILTQPLYVGITEVTQAEYEELVGSNPSNFSIDGKNQESVADLDTSNHPVEMINWLEAIEFCQRLNEKEGIVHRDLTINRPLDEKGYRLPTSAEWEHACRGGTMTPFWFGRERGFSQVGWSSGDSKGRTHTVGSLLANPFGLYDTHGNVWEWTQDADYLEYDAKETLETALVIDPFYPVVNGSSIETRGGGWINHPQFCRSSARFPMPKGRRIHNLGFRVVLDVESVRAAIP
ncbi:MAG: bifunctional serine/threonine-protein kinase/formylglycine-generating enzyme family protein [Planctomycetota bacterium]